MATQKLVLVRSPGRVEDSREALIEMKAALAHAAFARLNHDRYFPGDGPTLYDGKLSAALTPAAYQALVARLAEAGFSKKPETYADLFNLVVSFAGGARRVDAELLHKLGIFKASVTLEQLRSTLQLNDCESCRPVTERKKKTWTEIANEPAGGRIPRARPAGWTQLGEPVATVGDPAQPAKSGWYLGLRPTKMWNSIPINVGTHSAFGYYDAEKKQWGPTSAMRPEYKPGRRIPYPVFSHEKQLETMQGLAFFPIEPGPVARAKGLTPAQFHRAMVRDVTVYEERYRSLGGVDRPDRKIFYHPAPRFTPGTFDGNCNSYCAYLLKCLGIEAKYPRGFAAFGTFGSEVVTREVDGEVVLWSGKPKKQA